LRQPETPIAEPGPRAAARRIFAIGIWLLFASIIIQFLLAGLGVFADSSFFSWHANVNGAVVGLLPLVLVAIGWYGRVPRQTLLMTVAIFGLVVVQSLLLFPYHMGATGLLRAVSGLHVVNALVIFAVGLRLLEQSAELRHNRVPG
jgi:uncharacterized protein DUF6220